RENVPGKIRVLSVASGPAMEVQKLIADKDFPLERIEFCLLDQDLDSLKHAQRQILEQARLHNREINLKLYNLHIKQVIEKGAPERDFDLIYSAGLFDYFTDPVAIFAASQLFESLAKGGRLVIGNFSLSNPNQFAMDLIMDWQLVYRSDEDMKRLFGRLPGVYTLEQEEQGINFFANIIK
ncbi:MAG: methyltransferase domain-containing protein, partial [Pseudobdellovibrionaceae bacterium]